MDMNSQYSGNLEETADREEIKAIFEYVGIGSTSKVFDRFVQSDYGQQILENSLFRGGEKTVPRSINYLKWVPMENQTNSRSRGVECGITCFLDVVKGERPYRRFATVSLLESAVRDVSIGYLNGMVTFEPSYRSRFSIVSKGAARTFSEVTLFDVEVRLRPESLT